MKDSTPIKPDPAHIINKKYFNIWDKSDVLPLKVLKSIRNSDNFIFENNKVWMSDNNDPRTCDIRLEAMKVGNTNEK